jgi:hypothetical protein
MLGKAESLMAAKRNTTEGNRLDVLFTWFGRQQRAA